MSDKYIHPQVTPVQIWPNARFSGMHKDKRDASSELASLELGERLAGWVAQHSGFDNEPCCAYHPRR